MAVAISLSEKASSFGAISRLNHGSSRWPGCSRAQRRLRMPLADRFASRLVHGDAPAALFIGAFAAVNAGQTMGVTRRLASRTASHEAEV